MKFSILFSCLGLLSGCASTPEKTPATPDAPKPPISRVLTGIDLNLRTWNATSLDDPTEKNLKLANAAENTIGETVRDRFEEIANEMDTGSKRNRMIATACLGFCKEERALPYLIRSISDEDPEIGANALMSLGVLASPATPLPPILDSLLHSPNPQTRNQAAFLLVRICKQIPQEPELLSALRKALSDSEPGVRTQAAVTLGKVKDSEATDALTGLLQDSKPLVAAAAAFALGEIGDPKAGEGLIEAMESSSPRVRNAAHRALVSIFGQDKGPRAWDWKSSK